MTDLVTFLRERLNEDEVIARAASGDRILTPEWEYEPDGEVHVAGHPDWLITRDYEGLTSAVDAAEGTHIARHDPARALREVEAKRSVLARAQRLQEQRQLGMRYAWQAVTDLASAYSDHPDFDPRWA